MDHNGRDHADQYEVHKEVIDHLRAVLDAVYEAELYQYIPNAESVPADSYISTLERLAFSPNITVANGRDKLRWALLEYDSRDTCLKFPAEESRRAIGNVIRKMTYELLREYTEKQREATVVHEHEACEGVMRKTTSILNCLEIESLIKCTWADNINHR